MCRLNSLFPNSTHHYAFFLSFYPSVSSVSLETSKFVVI